MLESHFRSQLPKLEHHVPPATPHSWESAFQAYYVELCEYVLRFVGSARSSRRCGALRCGYAPSWDPTWPFLSFPKTAPASRSGVILPSPSRVVEAGGPL